MRYMDYENFKKEFKKYNKQDWTNEDKKYWDDYNWDVQTTKDGRHWLKMVEGYNKVGPVDNDGNFYQPEAQNDLVNSPAHYTRGSQECIDTIEEAIQDAPDPIVGSLQYQVLKYILRMWLKGNPLRDAQKAQWYLARLINKLENDD